LRARKWGGASVYIPSAIVSDSLFPLKVGEEVIIKIDPERKALIISKQ
jgi:hypothetical protein